MRLIKLETANEGKTFEEKIAYSINNIETKNSNYHVLKLSFYLNSLDEGHYNKEYETVFKIVKTYFKENIPAVTIVPLSTSSSDVFTIESVLQLKTEGKVRYKKLFNHNYTTVELNNSTELFSGGISFNEVDKLYAIQKTLDFVEQILDAEEMTFDALYKQNNYIGAISEDKQSTLKDMLNFYYGEAKFIDGRPLNMFIGTKLENLTVDICALNYGDEESAHKTIGNLKCVNSAEPIIISVKSSDKDDVELQTLHIINELFAELESITTNSEKETSIEEDFKLIKAFVKNESDINSVSVYLNDALPSTPKLIIAADSADKNKLIEIESIVSHKSSF